MKYPPQCRLPRAESLSRNLVDLDENFYCFFRNPIEIILSKQRNLVCFFRESFTSWSLHTHVPLWKKLPLTVTSHIIFYVVSTSYTEIDEYCMCNSPEWQVSIITFPIKQSWVKQSHWSIQYGSINENWVGCRLFGLSFQMRDNDRLVLPTCPKTIFI